jgi:hypothetical protein
MLAWKHGLYNMLGHTWESIESNISWIIIQLYKKMEIRLIYMENAYDFYAYVSSKLKESIARCNRDCFRCGKSKCFTQRS